MKVLNIKDVDGFFNVIQSCTGDVFLVSTEGDRINLKSRLSKYFALANVFASDVVDSVELITSNSEDTERLLQFMMDGH